MGSDEAALHHLWRQKRGEVEPEDLLGTVTEPLTSIGSGSSATPVMSSKRCSDGSSTTAMATSKHTLRHRRRKPMEPVRRL
jgi:hypothetical protein